MKYKLLFLAISFALLSISIQQEVVVTNPTNDEYYLLRAATVDPYQFISINSNNTVTSSMFPAPFVYNSGTFTSPQSSHSIATTSVVTDAGSNTINIQNGAGKFLAISETDEVIFTDTAEQQFILIHLQKAVGLSGTFSLSRYDELEYFVDDQGGNLEVSLDLCNLQEFTVISVSNQYQLKSTETNSAPNNYIQYDSSESKFILGDGAASNSNFIVFKNPYTDFNWVINSATGLIISINLGRIEGSRNFENSPELAQYVSANVPSLCDPVYIKNFLGLFYQVDSSNYISATGKGNKWFIERSTKTNFYYIRDVLNKYWAIANNVAKKTDNIEEATRFRFVPQASSSKYCIETETSNAIGISYHGRLHDNIQCDCNNLALNCEFIISDDIDAGNVGYFDDNCDGNIGPGNGGGNSKNSIDKHVIIHATSISSASSQIYVSSINATTGDVTSNTIVSVWGVRYDSINTDQFSLESQSTDRRLSANNSILSTVVVNAASDHASQLWTIDNSGCIQNVDNNQFLHVSGNVGALASTCQTTFDLIDVQAVSANLDITTPYHFQLKDQNLYLDNVWDTFIKHHTEGDLWEIRNGGTINDHAFDLVNFDTKNYLFQSILHIDDTIASNYKMQQWYLIVGDTPDEVCLLNQRWGSFIRHASVDIHYPATKAKLCDEDSKFLVTLPVTTDVVQGYYSIDINLGTGYHLMNPLGAEINAVPGTGIFELTNNLRTTFYIRSISTNNFLNIKGGQFVADIDQDQWYLIKKDNEKYCLQETITRLFVIVDPAGTISLSAKCHEGIFSLTRFQISENVDQQTLIRHYANPNNNDHNNVGVYNIKPLSEETNNHHIMQKALNSEFLEMEGEEIEIGKTDDHWLFVQPYSESEGNNLYCAIERNSGQFFEYSSTSKRISSRLECGGQFEFIKAQINTSYQGFAFIRDIVRNLFLKGSTISNSVEFTERYHLWYLHDTQDSTFSLKSFTSASGAFLQNNGEGIVTGVEEDRWFILDDLSNSGRVCLYNIRARIFLKIDGSSFTSHVDCNSSDLIIQVQSLKEWDLTQEYGYFRSNNNRYFSRVQTQGASASIIQEAEQPYSYTIMDSSRNDFLAIDEQNNLNWSYRDQRWAFIIQSNGRYCILNVDSGYFLKNNYDGTILPTATPTCQDTLHFEYKGEYAPETGHYLLKSLSTGKYIGNVEGTPQSVTFVSVHHLWKVIKHPFRRYSLQSYNTKRYLKKEGTSILQSFTQDMWYFLPVSNSGQFCMWNVYVGIYLSDNLQSDGCFRAHFELIPILIAELTPGFFTIKHESNYLDQVEETNVISSHQFGIWEIHQSQSIENQHTHEYLTISNSNEVQTSKKLDPWVKVLESQENQDNYCLLNINHGVYLSIQAGGISSLNTCTSSNFMSIVSIDPQIISDGSYKLKSVLYNTIYLGNSNTNILELSETSSLWNVKHYYDRTHEIRSADTNNYLSQEDGASNGFQVSDNFDDLEEWYFVKNVESDNSVNYCLLNAKKRFYLSIDYNNGVYSTIPSRDCADAEKFTIEA